MTHRTRMVIVFVLVVLAMAVLVFDRVGAIAASPEEEPDVVFDVFPVDSQSITFWDSWGAARSGGRRHQGTDIMADRGLPIVAVADGVVTEMGEARLSGYFIRVEHDGGWMTVAMHLNNDTFGTDDGLGGTWSAFYPTLMVGDEVTAGQVLGYVGDSGNAEGTRPHAHFELRIDGAKVNPYPYLVDVWKRQRRLAIPLPGETNRL